MRNIRKMILGLSILLSIAGFAAPAVVLADAQSDVQCGVNAAAGVDGCGASPSATSNLDTTINNIVNILSIVVGIVAVVMIVVAGFRYVTSGGNDQSVANAKKTLLYAVIGLVVVALAQTIARFVLNKTTK